MLFIVARFAVTVFASDVPFVDTLHLTEALKYDLRPSHRPLFASARASVAAVVADSLPRRLPLFAIQPTKETVRPVGSLQLPLTSPW